MANLIAETKLSHRGKTLQPGDAFEVRCSNTRRVLVATGKASLVKTTAPVEPEPAKVKRTCKKPATVEPEEPTTTTEAPEPKQTYKRRDMTAEGEDV